MSKNNASGLTNEELERIRQLMAERFNPTMFHTVQDREVLEKGTFRAVIWPSMNGNPFIFLGLGMIFASFFYGMRFSGVGMDNRATEMLGFRSKFQGLTIVALIGGFQVSSLRKKNNEKVKELERLKAGKLV